MTVKVGLESLIEDRFKPLKGRAVGLLANPASVDLRFRNAADIIASASKKSGFRLVSIFGPQQGFFETQEANMIEWKSRADSRWGVPVYSLYGDERRPTDRMLDGIDTFVVDLQDVGSKGYTFISTLFYVMEACARRKLEVMVLDRPNPLGGSIEGPVTLEGYMSFVGIHRLPLRHGLTIGEMATLFAKEALNDVRLKVIRMKGYKRSMLWPDTRRRWLPTTPNLPTFDSVMVYPGMELLEGTNISEGRGTTRPFEICGAPFIDPFLLAEELMSKKPKGAVYRPVSFTPNFDKYRKEVCYGVFIHVTDPRRFMPVRSALEIIKAVRRQNKEKFFFTSPPYEYEYEKRPFDILSGDPEIRMSIEKDGDTPEIVKRWEPGLRDYKRRIKKVLLYR